MLWTVFPNKIDTIHFTLRNLLFSNRSCDNNGLERKYRRILALWLCVYNTRHEEGKYMYRQRDEHWHWMVKHLRICIKDVERDVRCRKISNMNIHEQADYIIIRFSNETRAPQEAGIDYIRVGAIPAWLPCKSGCILNLDYPCWYRDRLKLQHFKKIKLPHSRS